MADETDAVLSKLMKGVEDAMSRGDTKKAQEYANEIKLLEGTKGTPEKTLGEAATSAFYNAPESFMKNMVYQPVDFVKTAVTDPGKAIGTMLSPLAGAALKIPGGRALDTALGGTPERQQQNEAAADAIGETYGNRYGSWKGFKEDLGNDPFAIIGDAASAAAPASRLLGAPLRAAGVEARMPGLLSTVGKLASNPIGEAVGAATRHLGNVPMYFSGPRTRARANISDLVDDMPNARADLAALGPHSVVADTLGSAGRRQARAASNLSPEAGDQLETFATQRAEGRPDRITTAEEDVRRRHRPAIDAAYEVAKAQGREFPKVIQHIPAPFPYTASPTTRVTTTPLGFEGLISDPLLRPFWNKSERVVEALERGGPQGDFARVDKFRSYLNKAAHTSRDPTQQLAFQEAVAEIDRLMDEANSVPGREAARAAHRNMQADVDLTNEETARRERRFRRTEGAITGNSTTVEQGISVANVLERANIMGDIIRGNYASGVAKVTGLLIGKGMERAQAQSLAAQLVEEARILSGREFPTRPVASQIQQGGQLLGDTTAYGTLLGGKINGLLQGGGGGY